MNFKCLLEEPFVLKFDQPQPRALTRMNRVTACAPSEGAAKKRRVRRTDRRLPRVADDEGIAESGM